MHRCLVGCEGCANASLRLRATCPVTLLPRHKLTVHSTSVICSPGTTSAYSSEPGGRNRQDCLALAAAAKMSLWTPKNHCWLSRPIPSRNR